MGKVLPKTPDFKATLNNRCTLSHYQNKTKLSTLLIEAILRKVWVIKIIAILVLGSSLISCEKSLNSKLTPEPVINKEAFDLAKGLKLPYVIYMPNSMTGWNLDPSTRFNFDEKRLVYYLDNISLSTPPIDDQGYRFKICNGDWHYQFGFGSYISDDESTIGIPSNGVVARLERFPQADTDIRVEKYGQSATDIRLEFPTVNKNDATERTLRVEFKLIRWEPNPEALLYLSIHGNDSVKNAKR